MKRRTIDASKVRRPIRRSRITDSVHGSWLLYLRFFIVWLLVISLDFLLEFRFEFLWPLWLLVRSTYDSFRYQGMGLTFLFLTVTVCSDLLFLVLLPIHWLFFAASTYVWVQFVWNTDRGPCLPTVFLWLLFVYVEASVRLRELKPLPFHLDLCRPFAAHCIGYPVVSLGYGFKSYIGFKLRQYKQEDVSKENDFYSELISYSLPIEMRAPKPSIKLLEESSIINNRSKSMLISTTTEGDNNSRSSRNSNNIKFMDNGLAEDKNRSGDLENGHLTKRNGLNHSNTESNEHGLIKSFFNSSRNTRHSKYDTKGIIKHDADDDLISDSESSNASNTIKSTTDFSPKSLRNDSKPAENYQARFKEEQIFRRRFEQQVNQMEMEIKRHKQDLHSMRQTETELRSQFSSSSAQERFLKSEIARIKSDNESIQQKLSSSVVQKQQDKTVIATLERKLKSERDARSTTDALLKESRKRSKENESQQAAAAAASLHMRDNHDACTAKRQELQKDFNNIQMKIQDGERRIRELEKENESLKKSKHEINDIEKLKKETEYLYSALKVMQNKNSHLENSLSSETRLKLDLFSALGDTRRQLEITQSQMISKEHEIKSLKGKIAEVMAVMPPHSYSDTSIVSRFSNHDHPITSSMNDMGQTSSANSITSNKCYSPISSNMVNTTSGTKNGIM